MATAGLFEYIAPLLNEKEVYPTRIPVPITDTFLEAAIALDSYERLKKDKDETSARLLGSIGTASQLILDASGYLIKNQKFFSDLTNEEIEVDHRFDFIMVYRKIFPEVDIEKIRRIELIAPIFAEKTRSLARTLSNPERLTPEERTNLVHKLLEIKKSIEREQYRANRFM